MQHQHRGWDACSVEVARVTMPSPALTETIQRHLHARCAQFFGHKPKKQIVTIWQKEKFEITLFWNLRTSKYIVYVRQNWRNTFWGANLPSIPNLCLHKHKLLLYCAGNSLICLLVDNFMPGQILDWGIGCVSFM